MRVAYLGPEGTNSHEALLAAAAAAHDADLRPVSLPTIHDCVVAVHEGSAERAFVPIENALEGSVNATLDALAVEAQDVAIVGEHVHAIRTCLIAHAPIELGAIETVCSHPQSNAQCARFLRTRLPRAQVLAASSTAEAVRSVAERDGARAALGSRTAAELYGCTVLCADVDDLAGNETRFVWLAKHDAAVADAKPSAAEPSAATSQAADLHATIPHATDPALPGLGNDAPQAARWKTAIVFWGAGDEAPGWLARCLTELADRGVNLTRIESRPRKVGLGHYMFFLDLEGCATGAPVADALAALGRHVEHLRVLGSYPVAPPV